MNETTWKKLIEAIEKNTEKLERISKSLYYIANPELKEKQKK